MADTLEKSIRAHLLGDQGIAGLVGTRVHHQVIPQSSTFPHIWFTRSGRDADDLIDGDGILYHRFIIEVAAEEGGETLPNLVLDRLNESEGPLDGYEIDSAWIEDVDEDYQFKSVDSDDAVYVEAFQLLVIE